MTPTSLFRLTQRTRSGRPLPCIDQLPAMGTLQVLSHTQVMVNVVRHGYRTVERSPPVRKAGD